jgi:hypothetical protein
MEAAALLDPPGTLAGAKPVDRGQDVPPVFLQCQTPLHVAVQWGRMEVVRWLLEDERLQRSGPPWGG